METTYKVSLEIDMKSVVKQISNVQNLLDGLKIEIDTSAITEVMNKLKGMTDSSVKVDADTSAALASIADITSKLKSIPDENVVVDGDTKGLEVKIKSTESVIMSMKKASLDLRGEITQLTRTMQDNGKSTKEVAAALKDKKRAVDDLKLSTSNLQLSLQGMKKALQEAKKATDDSDNSNKTFAQGLSDGSYKTDKFKESLGGVTGTLGALSAGVLGGVTGGIVAMSSSMLETAQNIQVFSAASALSITEFQQWDQTFQRVGYSGEAAAGDFAALTERMIETKDQVAEGGDSMSDLTTVCDALGLSVTNADGSLKSVGQFMPELMDAVAGVGDETQQAAIMTALFSTTGEEGLMPMLREWDKYSKILKEENKNILTEEQVAKMTEYKDAITEMKLAFSNAATVIASELLPQLIPLIEKVTENIGHFATWVSDNKELALTIAGVVTGVAGLIATATILSATITGLKTVFDVGKGGMDLFRDATIKGAYALSGQKVEADGTVVSMKNLKGATDGAGTSADTTKGKLEGLKGATDNAGTSSDTTKGKLDGLKGSTDNVGTSSDTTKGKVDGLKGSTDKLGTSAETTKGKKDSLKQATDALGNAATSAKGKTDGLKGATDLLGNANDTTKGKFGGLKESMDKVPTKVLTTGVKEATEHIGEKVMGKAILSTAGKFASKFVPGLNVVTTALDIASVASNLFGGKAKKAGDDGDVGFSKASKSAKQMDKDVSGAMKDSGKAIDNDGVKSFDKIDKKASGTSSSMIGSMERMRAAVVADFRSLSSNFETEMKKIKDKSVTITTTYKTVGTPPEDCGKSRNGSRISSFSTNSSRLAVAGVGNMKSISNQVTSFESNSRSRNNNYQASQSSNISINHNDLVRTIIAAIDSSNVLNRMDNNTRRQASKSVSMYNNSNNDTSLRNLNRSMIVINQVEGERRWG